LFAFGGATYTWNTGPVADSLGVQPTVSTSYTVIGSDINGCSSSAVYNVNVLPVPSVSIVGGPSVCSGKSVALTAAGAVTYTWFSGAQTAAINFSPSTDTTIFVNGTNAQGCKGTAIVSLQVLPTPTVAVANVSVCSGQTVALVAEPQGTVQNGITYLWLPGSASGANYNPAPIASSIYTLSSSLGSCVARTTVTVTVVPSTSVFTSFKYDSPVCSGAPPVFPVLSGSFTTGGTYYSAAGLTIDGFTGMIDLLNVPEGVYSIQYSIAAQDCRVAGLNGTFIQVKTQTKLSFPADSYTIGPGESVTLTVQGDASGFSWNPSSNLSCSNCKAAVASPGETTEYCVSSSDDCVSDACVKVKVICSRKGDFSVPTAFTPNGDGTNDTYCLKGWDECNKGFNVKIFDRWGAVVYESNSANFCWDGRYKGDVLPTGVYVYFITADYDEVPGYRQSGNISLIR
jgi:gliding motility-associated-like protein